MGPCHFATLLFFSFLFLFFSMGNFCQDVRYFSFLFFLFNIYMFYCGWECEAAVYDCVSRFPTQLTLNHFSNDNVPPHYLMLTTVRCPPPPSSKTVSLVVLLLQFFIFFMFLTTVMLVISISYLNTWLILTFYNFLPFSIAHSCTLIFFNISIRK